MGQQQAEDRDRAQSLAALCLLALLISLLLGQIWLLVAAFMLYVLTRAGYGALAARLMVYGAAAALLLAAPGSPDALFWLLLPLLSAVLLLSRRETRGVAALCLLLALGYPLLKPEIPFQQLLAGPSGALAFASILALLHLRPARVSSSTLPAQAPVWERPERLLQVLVEHLAAYVYIWEPDTNTVPYFNRDSFLGYSRDEFLSPGFMTRNIHPDDAAAVQTHLQAALSPQPIPSLEYRFRHQQGHWEWLAQESRLIVQADRDSSCPTEILVMLWRITERKAAEIELRQQEARNRALLNAIPDMIVHMDREGHYLQIWPFKRMREHPQPVNPDEIAGKHILDVLEPDVARQILNKIQQTLDSDEVQQIDYALNEASGRRSYEARWVPYGENEVLSVIRDVTQRKQVEARLERETNIFQNMLEAIVITEWRDGEYYVASMNQAAQSLYGWTLEEARGRPVTEVMQPVFTEDWPRSVIHQELARTGHMSAERTHHRKDGMPIQVFSSATMLRDEKGSPSGIITIVMDLTRLKETEAALKIAEDRLSTALKQSPVVLCNQDLELRYTWIHNPAVDFDPAQVLGKRDHEIPAYAEDAARLEALKSQVIHTGIGLQREIQLRRGSEERHYQLAIEPLRNTQGEITGITCVQVDITESVQSEIAQRKMQRLFQAVIAHVPIIVWALDKEGIITLSEGMGWQRLGKAGNTLVGSSAFSLYHDEPKMLYNIRRALDGEAFTDFVESSQGVQFQTHFHPIYDARGQLDGVVAVTIDLTERMHLEQNRLDLALERERINMLQRFMGDVSHDFKTPLTSIMLSVHLLSKANAPEDRQRHLDVIAMQTSRLENFMNDLFNMSRFDKGATNEFNFGRVNLNNLVSDVITAHQTLVQQKGHTLRWEPDAAVASVLGDQFQLDRVISNLLVNAVHYTPAGGQLALRTRQEDRWAIIEVQDNGLGIAPEDHERIFHRFYRGDPARSSDQGGMGVGLAIARKIIEAHGGKIIVESAPNAGSIFRVLLPVLGGRH